MAFGMEQLRKAGDAIRGMDEDYARRIMAMYPEGQYKMLGAVLGGMPAQKADIKPNDPPAYPGEGMVAKGLEYGLPAVSTTVRYGAPTAGVALAYHGLSSLNQVSPEEYTNMAEGAEQLASRSANPQEAANFRAGAETFRRKAEEASGQTTGTLMPE